MASLPAEWIFETTVLSAFGVVGCLDLLERRYQGRAHWCVEVQDELLRGVASNPRLGALIGTGWLGDPIHSFAVDRIELMRQRLGGEPSDDRHRGEAATIVVAMERGWIVATDDADATRVARSEGLLTIGTPRILRACIRGRLLNVDRANQVLGEMIDVHGRRLPRIDIGDLE